MADGQTRPGIQREVSEDAGPEDIPDKVKVACKIKVGYLKTSRPHDF